MGACEIRVTARGMSMREAFKNAVEEANDEHGHEQGYSGAINNCKLANQVKKGEYTDDEIYEKTDKREVWGYCSQEPIENANSVKSTVTRYPQKGSRKWKTVYEIIHYNNVVGTKDSQTEAITEARKYAEKYNHTRVDICITKILTEGNSRCATINYKPSNKEREGIYVFIGIAPE
jgi:hypothetical protein